MAEKVSLEKNSDIQEINKKLDFLIGEITQLKSDVKNLKSKNEEQLYKLDSRIYGICSEVISSLYKMQSSIYNYSSDMRDGNRKITEEVKELQSKTTYSKFMERFALWSPIIFIGLITWFVILFIILD